MLDWQYTRLAPSAGSLPSRRTLLPLEVMPKGTVAAIDGRLHAGQRLQASQQRAIGIAAPGLIVAGKAGVEFHDHGVRDAEARRQ